MSKDALQDALKALAPKTKAGKIRDLMPLIEDKISRGVRIADILQALEAGGLVLTEGTFKNYLHRFRSRQVASGIEGTHPETCGSQHEALAPAPGQQGPPCPAPVSMLDIDRLMKPDPVQQENELARYERLGKQQRRSQKS